MAPQKEADSTPGVAKGHEVASIPTGKEVSDLERVQSLMGVSIEESGYKVRPVFLHYLYLGRVL